MIQTYLQSIAATVLLLSFLSHAFVINSFNGGSPRHHSGLADTIRLVSLSDTTTLTAVPVDCTTNPETAHFADNSTHCIVWLSDVIRQSQTYEFPVTPLLDKVYISRPNSRLSYVPLIGPQNEQFCKGQSWYSTFPCAVLVVDTVSPQRLWLVDSWSGQQTASLNGTVQLPFNCSVDLPCAVRTQDPQSDILGGCTASTTASTLVIVTWNGTRFLFRPLAFFQGESRPFHTIHDYGSTVSALDGSLQFHNVVQTSVVNMTGTATYDHVEVCVMHVINANGSTSIYDIQLDDPSTRTGLALIAFIDPTSITEPPSPMFRCNPYLQHISISKSELTYQTSVSSNLDNTNVTSMGTLLSITCNDGRGWLWEYDLYAPRWSPYSVRLVGSFEVAAPQLNDTNSALIADIGIVGLTSGCDASSIDPAIGLPLLTYVTKVALLGIGVMENVTQPRAVPLISFATFTSSSLNGSSKLNLTFRKVSAAASVSQFNVSVFPDGNALFQHLQHGIGWVTAVSQPVVAVVSDSNPTCSGNTVQMVQWFCDYGMLYGAVTEEFSVLMNGTDGTIANEQRPIQIISNFGDGGSPYTVLGGISAKPVRLSTTSKEAFLSRLPASPSMVSAYRAGVGVSALVHMRNDSGKGYVYFLSLLVQQVSSVQISNVDNVRNSSDPWSLEAANVNLFTPTALTGSEHFTSFNFNQTTFVWAGSGAIVVQSSNMSSQQPSTSIHTAAAAITGAQAVSFDNMDQPPITMSVLNSLTFICDGETIYGYTEGISNFVFTINNLCFPIQDGECYCSPGNPIYSSMSTPDGFTSLFITMYYPERNATSLVVADIHGNILGRSTDLVTAGLPSGCDSSPGYEPKLYGDLVEVSSDTPGYLSILTPITGTRCMLMASCSITDETVLFAYFELRPDPPGCSVPIAYSSKIGFESPHVIVSVQPTFNWDMAGDVTYTVGGLVLSFDVTALWSMVRMNFKHYDEMVLSNGFLQLGSYPNDYWFAPFLALGTGTLVVANFFQININSEVAVSFEAYDLLTGARLYTTDSVYVPQLSPEQLKAVTMFTTSQLNLVGIDNVMATACLAFGNLICVVDISSAGGYSVSYCSCNNSCWGPPVLSAKTSQSISFYPNIIMFWATEGYPPIAIQFALDYFEPLWVGLSWGPSALRGGLDTSHAELNQTSCQDPVASKQGLFLKCSMLGDPTTLNLHLIDAFSGTLLLIHGPEISGRGSTLALTSDAATCIFVNDFTRTVTAITFESRESETVADPYVNVCAQDSEAMYVLKFFGDLDSIAATRTPFALHSPPVFVSLTKTYRAVTMNAFPTSIPYTAPSSSSPPFSLVQQVRYGADLLADLGNTSYPELSRLQHISLYTGTPSYIMSNDGSSLMSLQQCDNCYWCPIFCVLNTETGDQTRYTSLAEELTGNIKPYGTSEFNTSLVTYVVIQYSGNVSLNIARFIAGNTSYQQITCSPAATAQAIPARYCLRNGGSVWSVFEFANDSSAIVTTFLGTKNSAHGVNTSSFTAYTATSAGATYFSVVGELGMSQFLSANLPALPHVVESSNIEVSTIIGATQGINSMLPVTLTGQLVIITNAGNLTYTEEACEAAEDAIPMCQSKYLPFRADMADSSFPTVTWVGQSGSNWGSGFVATNYQVLLTNLFRNFRTGTAASCGTTYNRNCEVACQTTSNCSSLFHFIMTNAMFNIAYLPTGSTYTYAQGDFPQCEELESLVSEYVVDLTLRFYAASENSIIITKQLGSVEYVIATQSSPDALSAVLGATFKASRCQFFLLSNIVAQPFGWLAICAVKTLLLTVAFYFVERRIRGIERQKESKRNRIAFLRHKIEGKKLHLPRPSAHEGDDKKLYVSPPSTLALADAELCALELDLEREVSEEKALHYGCWFPNLLDSALGLLAVICGLRLEGERIEFINNVRSNFLQTEYSDNALTALLCGVLKEGLNHSVLVTRFSDFYQMAMCNGACWVIKMTPDNSSDDTIADEFRAHLEQAHAKLSVVFSIYIQSELVQSTQLEELLRMLKASTFALPISELKMRTKHLQAAGRCLSESGEETSLLDVSQTSNEGLIGDHPVMLLFSDAVSSFNKLHTELPNCFEFAVLPRRYIDAALQPSALLLVFSLLQAFVTILIYVVDIYLRGQSESQLSYLQLYQCVYFMIFNSALPATLLVNSIAHGDLQQTDITVTVKSKVAHVIRSPFLVVALLLLGPGILTHIIPGILLYIFVVIPLLAIPVGLEVCIRRLSPRLPTKVILVLRMTIRVTALFFVSAALSIAFNSADAYLWRREFASNGLFSGNWRSTGTYLAQPYFTSLAEEYKARSMGCVWERLSHTISNFLQMGFLFV